METVYLETTFISYLVAKPSRDILVAGHQQVSVDWWTNRRSLFECFVSQIVIDEASAGDAIEIQKRLAVIDALPVLRNKPESEALTTAIMASGILPPKAATDAAHIALAASHGIDYLLTWNCRHIANAQIIRRIDAICRREGYQMPIICTPGELMGEEGPDAE